MEGGLAWKVSTYSQQQNAEKHNLYPKFVNSAMNFEIRNNAMYPEQSDSCPLALWINNQERTRLN
jgi:hypothetical protein